MPMKIQFVDRTSIEISATKSGTSFDAEVIQAQAFSAIERIDGGRLGGVVFDAELGKLIVRDIGDASRLRAVTPCAQVQPRLTDQFPNPLSSLQFWNGDSRS